MNQRKVGIILSYVYTFAHVGVNLLYVPLLLGTIGQSEYGLYQIVGSIIAYLSIMESLLSAGILRYYCKYQALGDEYHKENVLAISKRIYWAISAIVVVAGIVLIWIFGIFYQGSLTQTELTESKYMLAILIANIVVGLNGYVYSAAITANEKFIFLKTLSIFVTILQPVAVLCVVYQHPYAVSVVAVQFVVNVLNVLIRYFYSKSKLHIKIKYHGWDRPFVKELLSLSSSVLLVMVADQIFWKADQLIIAKIIDTSAVAIYAIGSQIYLNYSPLGTAISGVFMPRLSVLYDKEHNMSAISELFIKVGRIAFLLLALVLSAFILYGKEFILIWAGSGYEQAYYIAVIIMIPLTIDVMQNMGLSVMQLASKYSFRGKLYFSLALFNIITTVFLVMKFGIVGAAVSTSIAMFFGNGVVMNIYYDRVIGLNIKRFWKEILHIIPGVLLSFLIGIFINYIHTTNQYLQFIVHGLLFCIVYFMLSWPLSMNGYEKELIKSVFKKFTIFSRCK